MGSQSRARLSDWTEATLQDVRGPRCHQQALEGGLGGCEDLGSTSSAEPHADPVFSGLRDDEGRGWVLGPVPGFLRRQAGGFRGTKTDRPGRLVKSSPHQFLFSNSRDSPQHQESG